MKTKLIVLLLLLTPLVGFAQGKIAFGNDSAHLFVLDPINVHMADQSVAGQPIAGTLPSGITLVAGLYAGTSSGSLTLQSTTTLLTGTGLPFPGRMANRSTLLTVPGGVPQWFRIMIWDSGEPDPLNSFYNGYYLGDSGLFQATPGTSISYPSIMPGSPANSTLGPGNIVVWCVCPEPSSLALTVLGTFGLVFCRRRKPRAIL